MVRHVVVDEATVHAAAYSSYRESTQDLKPTPKVTPRPVTNSIPPAGTMQELAMTAGIEPAVCAAVEGSI